MLLLFKSFTTGPGCATNCNGCFTIEQYPFYLCNVTSFYFQTGNKQQMCCMKKNLLLNKIKNRGNPSQFGRIMKNYVVKNALITLLQFEIHILIQDEKDNFF